MPAFLKLQDENRLLLKNCDADMEREHYNKGAFIRELFLEDKKALLPLPPVRFDTALYTTALTDKYGKFTLNKGKHTYSASPAFCAETVYLKITSMEVAVMDSNMHEIVRHKRLYGGDIQETMDWLPYLKYIARKPRSLRNSGIYGMMPQNMRQYMDTCPNADRGQILKVLSELTDRSGFESAVRTVDQAILYHATDADSLRSLYRRLFSDVPAIPPLGEGTLVPAMETLPYNTDLTALDQALKRGGTVNG